MSLIQIMSPYDEEEELFQLVSKILKEKDLNNHEKLHKNFSEIKIKFLQN